MTEMGAFLTGYMWPKADAPLIAAVGGKRT